MTLKQSNGKFGLKHVPECLEFWLLLAKLRMVTFDENPIGHFGSDALKFPMDILISFFDVKLLGDWRAQFRRNLHIQNILEHEHPWVQIVSFHQEWAYRELIAYIENLTNQVQHFQSLHITHVLTNKSYEWT